MEQYDITCIKNDVCNMAICDGKECTHRTNKSNGDYAVLGEGWRRSDKEPIPVGESVLVGLRMQFRDGRPDEVQMYVGSVHDESGDFIDFDGNIIGWETEDLEFWMPIPEPPSFA